MIESCHIYFIGLLPVLHIESARQTDDLLVTTLSLLGTSYELEWPLPKGASLKQSGDLYYVETIAGDRVWPRTDTILGYLSHHTEAVTFDVQYIGQAYGADGSRHAVDRLLKHETLQKISLKGIPDGFRLSLLLLAIEPNCQLFTIFNPMAKSKDDSGTRIDAGLDKLFGTSEQEQIALYEASILVPFSSPTERGNL